MKKVLTFALGLLIVSSMLFVFSIHLSISSSEPPETEWTKTFGGIYDDGYHEVELIKPDIGGYAIAGWTESYGSGSRDAWLIKTDEGGNPEWNMTYGGSGTEWVLSIIETSDDGYALFGHTNSYGEGQWDYWLVKINADGNMDWFKTYGGSGRDEGRSIVQTPDGGYALAGFTNSFGSGGFDYWIVKTDPNGNPEWNQTYGTALNEYAFSIILCDDGFAIAGQTGPHASSNASLLKIDSLGNPEWTQTYGGVSADLALSAVKTLDGGYALAGPTSSYGSGGQDFWLVKTDQFGTMEWYKTFGGINDEQARYVIQTNDGGYAVFGSTTSKGAGDRDFWLVKTDSNGNAEWDQTFGGIAEDWGDSLVQTSDGSFTLAGWTKSFGAGNTDIWLIKLAYEEIPATIDIKPDTLNLGSNGNWVTCYIELPESESVENIDVSTIIINDTIPVDLEAPIMIGDKDADSIPDLMVKFDRQAVIDLILQNCELTNKHETVTLTVTGALEDETPFIGNDIIKVKVPTGKNSKYIAP